MSTMRALVCVPESGPITVGRDLQRRREVRRGVRIACEAVADDGFRPLGRRTLESRHRACCSRHTASSRASARR